tara:strand:+ start:3898 stop:5118 length:1221 start_codon:yes stop_codon:yes gene_type:complete
MQNKIRNIFIIFLTIFSFLFAVKYLINNRKLKLLNEIYFKSPFLLSTKGICNDYQRLIEKSLNPSFSASIINDKGKIIASYNGSKLRIPASNLKLFSTAYTLSFLDVSDSLDTSIFKDNLNNYYLIGSGDPDLSIEDLEQLLNKINFENNINFYVLEVNKKNQWPKGWIEADKIYTYGSPITTLAIKSNENKSIDINFVKNIINNFLKYNNPSISYDLSILEYNGNYIKKLKRINSIKSSPILSLITLANSESHNFTAESIYKNASKSWNFNDYKKIKGWLRRKGFPIREITINDASGLSRENRLTTNLTALFLHKMRYSKQFDFYNSSLSLMGKRGTLSNRMINTEVAGNFFGKTGTLSNVFALSGYLYKDNEILSISIIQNNTFIDKNKPFNLLDEIYKLEKCY